MGLEIKKIKDVFYLKGNLNNTTIKLLKNHFNYTYDLGNTIILNFDGINSIDCNGRLGLEELYQDCLALNQQLCISGMRFDMLMDDLEYAA